MSKIIVEDMEYEVPEVVLMRYEDLTTEMFTIRQQLLELIDQIKTGFWSK